MSNIPNADLIRAILDGKTVQRRYPGVGEWTDAHPATAIQSLASGGGSAYEFRLKPEPLVLWHTVHRNKHTGLYVGGGFNNNKEVARDYAQRNNGKLLRLELDAETLDVISARTEEP